MGLPQKPNASCDIYRNANSPPATPDVQGVRCHLTADYGRALEHEEGTTPRALSYSHVMLVDTSVDVRDGYSFGTITAGNRDKVYISDKNGTLFYVVFVERRNRGGAADHLRVYLLRTAVDWAGLGGTGGGSGGSHGGGGGGSLPPLT